MCEISFEQRVIQLNRGEPIAQLSSFLSPQMPSAEQPNWMYSEIKPGLKFSATNDTTKNT